MFSPIQSLESRTFFAATPSPHITFDTPDLSQLELRDGVLIVNGTHKNDRITITRIAKADLESEVGSGAVSGVMGPTGGRGLKSILIALSTFSRPRPAPGSPPADWKNFATVHSDNLGDLTAATNSTSAMVIKTTKNSYALDASFVKRIQVNGGDGDDTIRIGKKIGVPATVAGGNGNDLLECGSKTDILVGGAGEDTLVAAGAGAIVSNYVGGAGSDRIQNFVFSSTDIPLSTFKGNGVEYILLAQSGRFTTT